MHIRAKTKPRGQRNCLQSSETGLYRGTVLWNAKKNKNNSAALNVLKSTVASIILKRKKFGTTRTGRPAKLSNLWRRALSRLVTKNLMVTLVELHHHICRWEKPTEGQTSLQHSTNLGFMAVWISSMKTCSRALWTSNWAESSPSNMTITLSTQSTQYRSGLGTTLWMS